MRWNPVKYDMKKPRSGEFWKKEKECIFKLNKIKPVYETIWVEMACTACHQLDNANINSWRNFVKEYMLARKHIFFSFLITSKS